ncbi:MAG: DMT family transporter [Magnetococcales bacterium]|nr:DMT family transporter [Magnetococcales bacterium]MBF0322543.1 DMT family transporter [Magnetococcales bacterium]
MPESRESIPDPSDATKDPLLISHDFAHVRMRSLLLATRQRWSDSPSNLHGIVWILLSGAAFSVVGAMVKIIGQDIHPFQIVFFRCLFGLLWLAPFLWRQGREILRSNRQSMHMMRALVGTTAMVTTFYAYALLPLADVTALSFTTPLFMIPLALLFLGEPNDPRRWVVTCIGFCGILVMVRPGAKGFDPLILIGVLSPFLIAIVTTVIKKMTATEKTMTILGRYAVASTVFSFPLACLFWKSPSMQQLLLLLLVSGIATVAQSALVQAYAVGEATMIAPFDYTRILIAGSIGYWFFQEIPDGQTILGGVIIMVSNLWLIWYTTRGKKTGQNIANAPCGKST